MAAERPVLVLASTSRYRRELLARLRLPFDSESPGVEESRLDSETPCAMTARLARMKAMAVATRRADAIVIGSDQTAELDGDALGKPGSHARAGAQLRACSGREVVFHTAVCVLGRGGDDAIEFVDTTTVAFRPLRDDEIERYLHAEQPYDCAGSFKSEGLGASLFRAIRSEDPSALIGLPLIRLADALRRCGLTLP